MIMIDGPQSWSVVGGEGLVVRGDAIIIHHSLFIIHDGHDDGSCDKPSVRPGISWSQAVGVAKSHGGDGVGFE